MLMPDPKELVTREELALALAVMREHGSVCLRILMARMRDDERGAKALEMRLDQLDEELANRWGLQDGSGGVH